MFITKPPVLASLEPDETLLLYIVATTQVVSAALVVERVEPEHVYMVQRLVYYISKVLSNCETRYNQVQKLLYIITLRATRSMWLLRMGSRKSKIASPREGSPSGLSSSLDST
jgi:hypothetical protein